MSKVRSKACLNCNAESESTFKYCPNCGQKNTDGKITFSELWSEFQDAIFNIESRTWNTLKNLFIPGKLTLEYFSGKHRSYLHPFRLLLVASILMIIAMSFQDFQSTTNHGYNVKDQIVKNYERQRIYRILKNITDTTKVIYPEAQTKITTDTILTSFRDSMRNLLDKYGDKYGDSININRYGFLLTEGRENISKSDFLNLNEDEMVATYKKDAGLFERLIFRQNIKLINDESQLSSAVVRHTTWAIFLMMPILALILYFLYIRHNYFYVEHLIFTFHFQSFAFLLLSVVIAGKNVFPTWVIIILSLSIWIYLFLSIRKVYKQSKRKTIFKFLFLSIAYLVLLFLIIYANLLISFLLL